MAAPSSDGMTASDLAYQAGMLQCVSRTFALTVPQLPGALRDVVGNAYLLCRIADTIEDEPTLSAGQTQAFAERFVEVVAGREAAEPFARELGAALSSATTASEHDLIANTPRVIRITNGFRAAQRGVLERCVRSGRPGSLLTLAPGRRRRSPASGSHRTERADFPHSALRKLIHSAASACSSRCGRRKRGRCNGCLACIW